MVERGVGAAHMTEGEPVSGVEVFTGPGRAMLPSRGAMGVIAAPVGAGAAGFSLICRRRTNHLKIMAVPPGADKPWLWVNRLFVKVANTDL